MFQYRSKQQIASGAVLYQTFDCMALQLQRYSLHSNVKTENSPKHRLRMTNTQKFRECSEPFVSAEQRKIVDRYLFRKDPEYLSIVFATGKVSVYRYEDEWTEMCVEGPLYLYRRKDSEYPYSILVMNRNKPEDVKFRISLEYHLEYQERFVICGGKDKKEIFGFLFENEDTAMTLFRVLGEFLSESLGDNVTVGG